MVRRKATERDAMPKHRYAVGVALDEQLVEIRQHKHRKFEQDRANAVSLQRATMPTSGATAEVSGAVGSGAAAVTAPSDPDNGHVHSSLSELGQLYASSQELSQESRNGGESGYFSECKSEDYDDEPQYEPLIAKQVEREKRARIAAEADAAAVARAAADVRAAEARAVADARANRERVAAAAAAAEEARAASAAEEAHAASEACNARARSQALAANEVPVVDLTDDASATDTLAAVEEDVVRSELQQRFEQASASVRARVLELYNMLDANQRAALHTILIRAVEKGEFRMVFVSGPAGAGKSSLIQIVVLLLENNCAVATPTNGARRADQSMVDKVLPRCSFAPRIEVVTTWNGFGVGYGDAWDAEAVVAAIKNNAKGKGKAATLYNKKLVIVDEGGQTDFTQLDMAARVGPRVNGGFEQVFLVLLDGVQTPPVGDKSSTTKEFVWEGEFFNTCKQEGKLALVALETVYRTANEDLLALSTAMREEDFEKAFPLVQKFAETTFGNGEAVLDVVHDNEEKYVVATEKHEFKPQVQLAHAEVIRRGAGAPQSTNLREWQPRALQAVRSQSKIPIEMYTYPGQRVLYQPVGKGGAKTVNNWYLSKGEPMDVVRFDAAQKILEVTCPCLMDFRGNPAVAFVAYEEVWVNLGSTYNDAKVKLSGPPWTWVTKVASADDSPRRW